MEKLLLIDEVAEILGVSPKTIRAWVARRYIPFRKVGRLIRFCPKSLAAWSKRQEIEDNRIWR